MPRPVLKKLEVGTIVKKAIDFYKMSSLNEISLKPSNKKLTISGDEEQLYRVFINLIKNSKESILEKTRKNTDFKGKISVEIKENNDYITITQTDNGTGIEDATKIMTPYFTTKKNGTGLGLPIVNKIINEHSGEISIINSKPGVMVLIKLPRIK
jgi:two-component system nitrogen regulation sensor histidine kinase NtrY